MAKPTLPPRPGDTVAQRYKVIERIGSGGQSIVFRAKDLKHGDDVALKILKQDVSRDPHGVERMFREAYAMTTLSGTAALRVMDQAWTDGGSFCLVTEFIDGVELNVWLDDKEKAAELVQVSDIRRLLEPIVFTLSAAHAQGILHRDLKPQNIFVLRNDKGVRLIDFGFAKFTRLIGFTEANMIAGSPSYIAPEAWAGKNATFNQQLDVYGLAAIIFRCLGGQTPFKNEGLHQLLKAVTTHARPSLVALRPDLPQAIDSWVECALAIKPEERFQSMEAMWNAFNNATRV